MNLQGRKFLAPNSSYRYGFNGQEKDNEVYGTGNLNTAEYWEYDTRIGRRWNVDPSTNPSESPYACLNNNPILFIDPNGDKPSGPDDPKTHTVKKGDNLETLSKKYGVKVNDLVKLNHLKNANKIKEGQILDVNPEVNFSNNPYGGYKNPDNSEGRTVNMSSLIPIGVGFYLGTKKDDENLIISGGDALEKIKNWDAVKTFAWDAEKQIFKNSKNGKLTIGETYENTYHPPGGGIVGYMKKALFGDQKINSPVHVIGSFNFSARVNADGKSMTISVYDSKTISSGTDNQFKGIHNKQRDRSNPDSQPIVNQYIRFIWTQELLH